MKLSEDAKILLAILGFLASGSILMLLSIKPQG